MRFYEKSNKSAPSDSDIFVISSGSGTSWADYKVTWAQLKSLIKAINDMTNYYTKSQTYTKSEVDALVGDLVNFEVVQELPTSDISTHTIYLLPKNPGETDNVYEEWINTTGTSAGWEKIGETSVDLSNYYTKSETEAYVKGTGGTYVVSTATFSTLTTTAQTIIGAINEVMAAIPTIDSALSDSSENPVQNKVVKAAVDGKVDKVVGKGLSENDYTTTEKQKLAGIEAGAQVNTPIDSAFSDSSTNPVQNKVVKGALDDKADKTGSYGMLASGSVLKNDTVKSTDTTPFLFRPIPPLSTPYVRERLVGASVAWNQLVNNGDFSNGKTGWVAQNAILTNDGVLTATAQNGFTYRSVPIVNGHAYLAFLDLKLTTATNLVRINPTSMGNWTIYTESTTVRQQISGIKKATESATIELRVADTRPTNWDDIKIYGVMFIDLTLAFGTAIADRIYSMEQAQAGSGIAWIKSYGFLTEDYYAYGSGIQSVCADRKVVTGFNLWDEEWESGGISGIDGTDTTGSDRIRSKNYISIISGCSYYFFYNTKVANPYICEYDANKNFIRRTQQNRNTILTLSSDCAFIRFFLLTSTYEHDICINISDTAKNGIYEPYHKTTILLAKNTHLRGHFVLDSNNNLVCEGDEYTSDGTISNKVGVLENQTGAVGDTITLTGYKTNGWVICDQGILSEIGTISGTTLTLTKALSAATIEYELATPTTTQSTPFQSPQYLFDGGTEEFVDYGVEQETRDVAVPVGHVTEY